MELDTISITRKYRQLYKEEHSYDIIMLGELASGRGFVMNEALLLLEMDIRSKFCALLSKIEKEYAAVTEFEAAAIWKQCHDHMADPSNDVFKAVDHLHRYLSSCFPDQMNDYNFLREAVPKLIERIRKRANTRKFIDSLTYMVSESNETHEQRMCVKILTDWLILSISGLKLPEDFYKTLNQLKSNWNV